VTLKDIAQKYGYSRQTAYNRIKAAGIDLSKYRGEGGNLTPDGIDVLNALFTEAKKDAKRDEKTDGRIAELTESFREKLDSLQREVESLRKAILQAENEAKEQRNRAEHAEQRLADIQNERRFLRVQLDGALKAVTMASVPRLEAPKSLLAKLRAAFSSGAEK